MQVLYYSPESWQRHWVSSWGERAIYKDQKLRRGLGECGKLVGGIHGTPSVPSWSPKSYTPCSHSPSTRTAAATQNIHKQALLTLFPQLPCGFIVSRSCSGSGLTANRINQFNASGLYPAFNSGSCSSRPALSYRPLLALPNSPRGCLSDFARAPDAAPTGKTCCCVVTYVHYK
jgi:hypothetical protein